MSCGTSFRAVTVKEEPHCAEHGDGSAGRAHELLKLEPESDCSDDELQQEPADRQEARVKSEDPLSLYEGHEVNEEMVIGSEVLQQPLLPEDTIAVKHTIPQRCSHSGQSLSCDNCKKTDNITHSQDTFSCNTCNKTYSSKLSLLLHQRVHTGNGLLTCDICNKKFTRRSSLTTHLEVHSGKKPFACSVCDKMFTQRSYLACHQHHCFKDQMPPKTTKPQNAEERRKAKRERERNRRAKIKENLLKYEEAKRKERERCQRRKLEKKILLIDDLTPREKREQRKEWRDRARNSRLSKKLAEHAERAVRDRTPSTDSDIDPALFLNRGASVIRAEAPSSASSIQITRRTRQPEETNSSEDENSLSFRNNILRREKLHEGSPESVSSTASINRQKLRRVKLAKRQRELSRVASALQKQEDIIREQRNMIRALQKKIQRLTSNQKQKAARSRQRVIDENWAGRKQSILKFFEDDQNSSISPGAKDTRRQIEEQKRYLRDSLEKLHKKYNAQSPQRLRVSYATFCRVRPFWILKAKLTDRDV